MQIHEHTLWPAARHTELIAEAQRLHEAARAVREARRGRGEAQASDTAVQHGAPAHHLTSVRSQPSRRPAWRAAAWSMGRSLVTVGRRLERLGGAAD